MQEWLDNNDILMYFTHNEGKSVIAGRFIKTLKSKIYKKTTANDSKFYLPYLNKLVDEYNKTYHHSIDKKPINASLKNLRQILKLLNLRVKINNYKNIFSKGYTENWKKDFIALKAKVDKLDINKLVNVLTSLNNSKAKKMF